MPRSGRSSLQNDALPEFLPADKCFRPVISLSTAAVRPPPAFQCRIYQSARRLVGLRRDYPAAHRRGAFGQIMTFAVPVAEGIVLDDERICVNPVRCKRSASPQTRILRNMPGHFSSFPMRTPCRVVAVVLSFLHSETLAREIPARPLSAVCPDLKRRRRQMPAN